MLHKIIVLLLHKIIVLLTLTTISSSYSYTGKKERITVWYESDHELDLCTPVYKMNNTLPYCNETSKQGCIPELNVCKCKVLPKCPQDVMGCGPPGTVRNDLNCTCVAPSTAPPPTSENHGDNDKDDNGGKDGGENKQT